MLLRPRLSRLLTSPRGRGYVVFHGPATPRVSYEQNT
jgi:hypothetical protein